MGKDINADYIDEQSTILAKTISEFFLERNMTFKKALVVLIAGIGKLLQILCKITDNDKDLVFDAFLGALKKYKAIGGDKRIDMICEITKSSREAKDMN